MEQNFGKMKLMQEKNMDKDFYKFETDSIIRNLEIASVGLNFISLSHEYYNYINKIKYGYCSGESTQIIDNLIEEINKPKRIA